MYKDAKVLFSFLLKIVRGLPKEFRFEMGSQLTRAGFSVILNIAEGSGKRSDKDMNRYFDIALGSLFEVLAAVDVLKENNFVSEEEFDTVLSMVDNISRQLGGFKKTLIKSNSKSS